MRSYKGGSSGWSRNYNRKEGALAKEDSGLSKEQLQGIEHLKQRVDYLDQRLDNVDSVVSAVVERVMVQPVVINVTCPHCGKRVEINLIGAVKPGIK